MKHCSILIAFLLLLFSGKTQPYIHAHNDYNNPRPLFEALENKAWSIEADVFLVRGSLLVGHSLKETSKRKSLLSLYIHPIIDLFKQNGGFVSDDRKYSPRLVLDIKQNGPEVLKALIELLDPLKEYFDRSVNPNAVQIIISGERGPVSNWTSYPSYILFDGRPYEEYDQNAVDKIAMISDNYFNYIETKNNRGDSTKIREVVSKARSINKPMRFWGAPDNEATWKFLTKYGADILNTDKPVACRKFLESEL